MGNESVISRTDVFPKIGSFQTMTNIVKSFIGLGILASPSGFQSAGYIPAASLIMLNGALNIITVSFQTRTRDVYRSHIKNYSDLGEAEAGRELNTACFLSFDSTYLFFNSKTKHINTLTLF